MFEKTLQDVVKGIRASKRDTALYISQCIAEIKTEINSSDMYIKANALQKLTFLHMMGYSMSWASFATIEVMSSPRFAQKRIGYLAASQGFHKDTDVILLSTNLLKKELRSANVGGSMAGVYEAGLAINCISNIITPELAQDLLPELTNLTAHPQPYLRKKAILCLFKLFVQYPQGLRLTFAKLQQCLNDPNPAVVSCAVNVITELSDKNPKNYLHLAPAFFDLLTNSSNNWMLIKVVKLLGSLVQEEPRLARKLLEPLADIVRKTPAKSLLYEAAHAITKCLPYCRKNDGSMPAIVPDIVALCAQTFKDFVQEQDQNLKYLGLVGFGTLMVSFPKVLSAPTYRPLILTCLSDDDVTIRSRALDLLPSMATRKNLMELVSQLLQHVALASGEYKLDLVAKIVEMCSGEKYALLQDFTWYLDILFQLGHMRGLDTHAELLRFQVSDVALRVLPARSYAVKRSIEVLLEGDNDNNDASAGLDGAATVNSGLSMNTPNFMDSDNGRGKHIMPEILPALAWIVGEYSDLLPEVLSIDSEAVYIFNNDSEGPYHSVIQAITAPCNSNKLPMSTQSVFLQAALKILAAASANAQVSDAELEACINTISRNLMVYMESANPEVRERAVTLYMTLVALDLIPSPGYTSAPGLMALNDDENDDESDTSDNLKEGNLLDMPGLTSQTTQKNDKQNTTLDALAGLVSSSTGRSLAAKCRNVSQTLNYLLKPSPMKPTGSKAQRKKYQSPIGLDGVDLNAPLNESIFSSWIEEEKAQRSKYRLTIESVSFTQQRPMVVSEYKNIAKDAISSVDTSSSIAANAIGSGDLGASGGGAVLNSFQSSNTVPQNMLGNRPQTANDPFYLNSSSGMYDNDLSTATNTLPNKFGAIQLGDEDEDDANGKKKKKKKKEKKQKHEIHIPPDAMSLMTGPTFGQNVTIYSSDDEDDADVRLPPGRRAGKKGAAGKEFSSLAKVDLTMPLRDDEVMPERKHRVVPDRPAYAGGAVDSVPQKHKKKKKDSKRAKKASKQGAIGSADGVGDLLDLGGFASVPDSSATPSMTGAAIPGGPGLAQNQKNAINNAFDDLLGVANTVPAPVSASASSGGTASFDMLGLGGLPTIAPLSSPHPSKPGKRPYLRATIKVSAATGSPVVDWSKVQLSYRVYRVDVGNGVAASISVRADNMMEMSPLSGLVLRLKNFGEIPLGNVAPRSSLESSKVGPFVHPTSDMPLEMKGTLDTSECSVPVKLILPVSVHLSPHDGLTLQQVASELSSPEWAVHSAKIPLAAGIPSDKIKSIVGTFLQLAEVEPSDPSYGTFAGQSSSTGTLVRVLIKVKPDVVKVDVKCRGNVNLGKALVSELKKLVL
ncbi:adaptin N terminal region-domain containing protein [Nitzschia inconspicua]|uniref:Adaptin N terminal region-domain containing protein n=1 Tax=Nitzschia inconspicua TaxID=303405 RepID=A0A9K3LI64_9STRA|nr:adaptin N terminal region-domain containing protein [Nitzschia inconspicua]